MDIIFIENFNPLLSTKALSTSVMKTASTQPSILAMIDNYDCIILPSHPLISSFFPLAG